MITRRTALRNALAPLVLDRRQSAAVVLFQQGDAGVHTYRIPALVETRRGKLLAVADARHNGGADMPAHISLAMRTSRDKGKTWAPPVMIRQVAADCGVGDASFLLDKRTGRVWCFHSYGPPGIGWGTAKAGAVTGASTFQFHAMYSDDEGATWSKARDLTPQVKEPGWQALFATSGTHFQTSRGRYLVPMVVRDEHGTVSARNAYSDDAGDHWQIGAAIGAGSDESKCVELADGSILQNMRYKQSRAVAVSRDGGVTFGALREDAALPDPVCNAGFARYAEKRKDLLLFSNCASGKRENLTLKISANAGATWERARTLHAGKAAYSTVVPLRDGSIAVLYECGETSPYSRIVFERFQLNEI